VVNYRVPTPETRQEVKEVLWRRKPGKASHLVKEDWKRRMAQIMT